MTNIFAENLSRVTIDLKFADDAIPEHIRSVIDLAERLKLETPDGFEILTSVSGFIETSDELVWRALFWISVKKWARDNRYAIVEYAPPNTFWWRKSGKQVPLWLKTQKARIVF